MPTHARVGVMPTASVVSTRCIPAASPRPGQGRAGTKKKERAPAASALSSARDCALLSRSRVSPQKHHLAAGSEEGSVQRRRLRRADQHTMMMMVMMVVVTPLSSLLPTGVCTLIPHSPPYEKHLFNRTPIFINTIPGLLIDRGLRYRTSRVDMGDFFLFLLLLCSS